MDTQKTGELIAQRRKELKLTQKMLAEQLNVSDRTVSKWERGAGFPDVSLIEPLADALGLNVLEVLRGERMSEEERRSIDDVTVREALQVLGRHGKREVGFVMKSIKVLAMMFLPVVLALVVILRPVDMAFRWEERTMISLWTISDGRAEITDSAVFERLDELLDSTYFCDAFWARFNRGSYVPQMTLDLYKDGPRIEYYANGTVYVCADDKILMELPVCGKLHDYLYRLKEEQTGR